MNAVIDDGMKLKVAFRVWDSYKFPQRPPLWKNKN